jgi:pimeloyl-ACP methyl ester carboxylesterase
MTAPSTTTLTGAAGNRLIAEVFGAGGPPVLLLHGGGQTRHAWRRTAEALARDGWTAYAADQRGHGDSEWVADGAYRFKDFAADVRSIASTLAKLHGRAPVVIGASLGGIATLLAQAEPSHAPAFAALVLVDITPRVDRSGVERIQDFMRVHATDGFASVADAADAVAAYLPHRPRPKNHEGLKKNLRLHDDGRWRWHWDPRFLGGRGVVRDEVEADLIAAARRITVPTLLVRGSASELVGEDHAREFLDLVPHAEYADVNGARHMVVGDRNDAFSAAILDFVSRVDGLSAKRKCQPSPVLRAGRSDTDSAP